MRPYNKDYIFYLKPYVSIALFSNSSIYMLLDVDDVAYRLNLFPTRNYVVLTQVAGSPLMALLLRLVRSYNV